MVSYKRTTFTIILCLSIICTGPRLTRAHLAIDDFGCRTPRRGVGMCVVVHNCKPFIDFIQDAGVLSSSTVDSLQNYHCGYKGDVVKVCCPRDGQILIPKHKESTKSRTGDFSQHRNIDLLPSNCGTVFSESSGIPDDQLSFFEYPWIAVLSYQLAENETAFVCRGSIINSKYILTAAHCVSNLSKRKIIGVQVGQTFGCEQDSLVSDVCPSQSFAIEEVLWHPNYNGTTFDNNIALIRLSSPIEFNATDVKPICLPLNMVNQSLAKANLTIVGWDLTEADGEGLIPAKPSIAVVPEEECRKAYDKSSVEISTKQICISNQDKTALCGNNLGMLLEEIENVNEDIRFVQQGIDSYNSRVCNQNPKVFTKVAYYVNWILDNIKP